MSKQASSARPQEVKLSYLFALAGGRQRGLYAAVCFSILAGLCAFVPYVMIYRVILLLFGGHGGQAAARYGLIAAGFILLRTVFQAASAGLAHYGAYDALYAVRKKLCAHIGEVNLGFFTSGSTGEIKKVLMEDVERLEQFLAHQIPDITVAAVVPCLVFVYLLTVSLPMALALLAPILLTLLVQLAELAIARPAMEDFSAILGRCNSAALQYINGMQVMKAYDLTADSYQSYSQAVADYNRLWVRFSRVLAPMSAFSKVVIESGIGFMLPLGGALYLAGRLELGAYLFFVIMSLVFLSSYSNLLNFAQIFSQVSAGLGRIKAIMDLPAIPEGRQLLRPGGSGLGVTFSHVCFTYQDKEVLHDLCLELKPGTLTAFVGVSGAGKSTAAQLIPRFWDVTAGSISVGGQDIRTLQAASLMDNISFVFQDAFLLEDTVCQNIAVGKRGCTPAEVEQAAKAAQIDGFIRTLPDGYATRLGAAGVKLSGGEKQRVCIARALLKGAPLLIFDEATSFTDIDNERRIQLALEQLLKGKTAIMIAHRLHTVIHADQICVFKDGRVVETGRHPELLRRGGVYAEMWRTYTARQTEVADV